MTIEVVPTTASETKLTIAKDRVTIKYHTGLASELRERQYRLALKAIKELQRPDMVTRRGKFSYFTSSDTYRITMYIQTKSKGNNVDPITFQEEPCA